MDIKTKVTITFGKEDIQSFLVDFLKKQYPNFEFDKIDFVLKSESDMFDRYDRQVFDVIKVDLKPKK